MNIEMDSNADENWFEGVVCIEGIPWHTTVNDLRIYFRQYGKITDAEIIRDSRTEIPTGFGFLVFSTPSALFDTTLLNQRHIIDDRIVEVEHVLSREEVKNRIGETDYSHVILVAGIADSLSGERFREYFGQFGCVREGVIICSKLSYNTRGYGFISFAATEDVEGALTKFVQDLDGYTVVVTMAADIIKSGCVYDAIGDAFTRTFNHPKPKRRRTRPKGSKPSGESLLKNVTSLISIFQQLETMESAIKDAMEEVEKDSESSTSSKSKSKSKSKGKSKK